MFCMRLCTVTSIFVYLCEYMRVRVFVHMRTCVYFLYVCASVGEYVSR